MTLKTILKHQIKQVVAEKYHVDIDFQINYPPSSDLGDYSCNVAMILAPLLKKSPLELAKELKENLTADKMWQRVEVAKPGFLNFYLSEKILQNNLKEILKAKDKFGSLKPIKKEKIMVEFISANPTGPLTLANGRGGFSGDVLANVLKLAGHIVEREYYINDYGNQVRLLGHSVLKDSEAQYSGEYIDELGKRKEILKHLPAMLSKAMRAGIKDDKIKKDNFVMLVGEVAAKIILAEMIKPVVKKVGIKFDHWFSEKKLHDSGQVEKIFNYLNKKDLVYKHDGAWWLKTVNNEQLKTNSNEEKENDEKDRVLIKSDGEKTYFLVDIAYHLDKFKKRKFDRVINLWGADHHGYVARMKQAMTLLGYCNQLEILLMQMVRLIKNGQEYRMSKRAGVYITLAELIDEVGLDVARFFFLMHANNKQMDFDLDLAKERSNKNPVFYVQYAHARICSVLKNAHELTLIKNTNAHELNNSEKELIAELIKWPDLILEVAKNYEVHKIPFYAIALADKFHNFYEQCRVIEEKNQVNEFRLNLVKASKQVLENILKTLGVGAPEKM